MFAIIIGIVFTLLGMGNAQDVKVTVIPPMPNYAPVPEFGLEEPDLPWLLPSEETTDEMAHEFAMFWHESYEEHEAEFTALFNSLETKWSKNGRLMIRQGDTGSFKFVKRSA